MVGTYSAAELHATKYFAAEILGRHFGRGYRAQAGNVRVNARHVLDQAEFHHVVGDFLLGARGNPPAKSKIAAVAMAAELFMVSSGQPGASCDVRLSRLITIELRFLGSSAARIDP